jgi:hypothetical protein
MAFSDTSAGATADIFRSKAEAKYFDPSRHNYDDWSAALKSFSGSESERDTAFQRELDTLKNVGFKNEEVFDEWMSRKEQDAITAEEAAQDKIEQDAEDAQKEKMSKRQSRKKSRITGPFGILEPARIGKKRLLGA